MLLEGGTVIDAPDGNGKSPLHWAVHMDKIPTVRLLLAHGADVNAWDVTGETPSQLGSRKGHHAVVELLSEYGSESVEKCTSCFGSKVT